MKAKLLRYHVAYLLFFLLWANGSSAQTQGRVVINEYMPWTSNGCGTTAEFVELLNFGPGPVDISCYILTTGVYSITIPKTTIIQPGEFFVISGQNFIPNSCANVDSSATGISVDLNWNTCNCTNVAIPTTGDGMMKDGGNSNTPLVLMDPSLNIIDAVVRNMPTEVTQTITSKTMAGACVGKTFNIGTMNPNYEVLGMSTGRGNSFARTLDGDCNWLKDPQQSANASNNRSGRVTDISYDFDMVNPTSCEELGKGSVSIYVKHSNYASVFPMTYTIATDNDNDGLFELNETYETVIDNDPPFIEINDLPVGHFRVTVASVKGCYLKTFEFTIIPCNPSTLPVRLVYFKNKGVETGGPSLEWLMQDVQYLQSVVLEGSADGGKFAMQQIFVNKDSRGTKQYSAMPANKGNNRFFRLKITQKSGKVFYSPVINTADNSKLPEPKIWPNPATDQLTLELASAKNQPLAYTIYNSNGVAVGNGRLSAAAGSNNFFIPVKNLAAGVYHLQVNAPAGGQQPISFRFVKH